MTWEPPPPYDIPERKIAESVVALMAEIEATFPEDAALATKAAEEYFGEPWSEASEYGDCRWIEEFAYRTAAAMKRRDEATVLAHLTFFSERLKTADKAVFGLIDVSYMENILRKLDKRSQRWAWLRIPGNLKELYVHFWGVIAPSKINFLESRRRRPKAP